MSADYFNSCSNYTATSVPVNTQGYQFAKDGNGYAGISIFTPPSHDPMNISPEYLITQLQSDLEPDSFYQIKMYVNNAEWSRFGCDCMEIWLTKDYPPMNASMMGRINGQPQLRTPKGLILKDTANWTELCWIYKAKGGEQFMTIGNFEKNTEVSTEITGTNIAFPSAYYFIDDVSVEKIPHHIANFGLGEDVTVCPGGLSDTLTVQGAYTSFFWNTGDTSQSITITGPGTYWVEARLDGCFIRDTIRYVQQPLLSLDLGKDTAFCPGESIRLSAGNGFDSYHWSTGESGKSIEVKDYGEYRVEASYFCDTLRDTIAIFQPPALSVVLPADTLLPLGNQFEIQPLFSGIPVLWEWQPATGLSCTGCPFPISKPLENTLYSLLIKDEYGCQASDEILISVENRGRVYVPNAFSPGGDGINDIFTLYGGPEVGDIISMNIFDRWGELVFSKEHFPAGGSNGWDGTFKGKVLLPGVYVYVLEVAFLNGEKRRLAGEVVLMK